jgi:hypothetical protein
MTQNWSEDFELEARRHEAGTDAEQRDYELAQQRATQEGIVIRPMPDIQLDKEAFDRIFKDFGKSSMCSDPEQGRIVAAEE